MTFCFNNLCADDLSQSRIQFVLNLLGPIQFCVLQTFIFYISHIPGKTYRVKYKLAITFKLIIFKLVFCCYKIVQIISAINEMHMVTVV